jgi:hypothetical protein
VSGISPLITYCALAIDEICSTPLYIDNSISDGDKSFLSIAASFEKRLFKMIVSEPFYTFSDTISSYG